jgi:hypothetical protein
MATLALCACASSQFDRALDAHRWSEAASAFDADSSLLHDESALYRAAVLHAVPGRPTYDPLRASQLFQRLLQLYPQTSTRADAVARLSLLYEIQRVQNVTAAEHRTLQATIARLVADTLQLRVQLDSLASRMRVEQDQNAQLHKDLQDRETRLRRLHEELDHLKAIDLKPALPATRGDTGRRVKPFGIR